MSGNHRVRQVVVGMRALPKIPVLIILGSLLMALSADVVVGWLLPNESAIDLSYRYIPPWPIDGSIPTHPLGTDALGRDVLSRMIVGAKVSLSVAFVSILFAATVGVVLGLISGYMGGWVDMAIMRVVDVMLSFPAILVALIFVVTVGPSFWMVVSIVALLAWTQFARLVRGEVLSCKERDFVVLARLSGASARRIIVKHILPNVLSSIVVLVTLQVGWVIIVEAALSFLGAGIPPPTPTWGNMVAEGRGVMKTAWWISLFPGIAISLVVLAFNLFGDWLRDTLDPRLRQVIH